MLIKKVNERNVSVVELMYLYLCKLIDSDTYQAILYKLVEVDEDVIDIMVNYEIEKGYDAVHRYMNHDVKELKREELAAKTILLLNDAYPLAEYENLKKIDEQYPLPFYIPYFLYGVATDVIEDIYGKKIIDTTGDRTKDIKSIIQYYEGLLG